MLSWLPSSSRAHGSVLDTSGACRKTGRGCWTDPTRGCVTSTPQAKYRPLLRHFFGAAFRTHRMVHSAHCSHEELKARAAALAPVLIDRHRTKPPKTQRAASRRGPELHHQPCGRQAPGPLRRGPTYTPTGYVPIVALRAARVKSMQGWVQRTDSGK